MIEETKDKKAHVARRMPGSTHLAALALAMQSVFLGYNWVVMKIGLRYAAPLPFTALRTGLGAVVLLILLVVMRRPLRPRRPFATFCLGLLQTTGFIGLLMWALESGAAGRVSALVYTMPVWALLLGWLFLGERLSGWQWLAVACCIVGLLLILDPSHLSGSWQSKLLALGSGLSWAGAATLTRWMNREGGGDVLSLTTWQTLFGCIPLVVAALVVPSEAVRWSATFVGALAYNVVPATALSLGLWLYALRSLPAGIAGLSTLATPVIGIVAAAVQLGERVTPMEAAGIACILAGLLILVGQGLAQSHSRVAKR